MQTPEPTSEHQWLMQLVGDWNFTCECIMGPDQPPMKSIGTQSTRALGSLWILGEMVGEDPSGQPALSIITLGYDPAKNRFVGTFVASCMTHLWPYEGQLDSTGKVLTLNSSGPSFLQAKDRWQTTKTYSRSLTRTRTHFLLDFRTKMGLGQTLCPEPMYEFEL